MLRSNLQRGPINLPAKSDLTGLENHLVKIANNSGVANFDVIAAITDDALYALESGDVAGNITQARPLNPNEQFRVPLKGTCSPGDHLVLADPSTSADAGKVRTVPVAAGTYRVIAFAEEVGVDGQLVLLRPASLGNVVVSS